MTGTPLDLTPFGGIVTGIGWLYWLLALGLLVLAIRRPKTLVRKVVWSLLVVLVFGLMPGMQLREDYIATKKLRAATAHFEMRCKSAGEKITRTVENVDGVVWMKWRDKQPNKTDQFKLDDPYGHECSADGCITTLLRITEGVELDREKKQHRRYGYRFVESTDPADGKLYRYSLRLYRTQERDKRYGPEDLSTELVPQAIDRRSARYGVSWDDISTREDREHWIAGGSLKVIDLQSNEVIAERLGFMLDRGQGNWRNGPTPWSMAERSACPPFAEGFRGAIGRKFVHKVLQPTKEE